MSQDKEGMASYTLGAEHVRKARENCVGGFFFFNRIFCVGRKKIIDRTN